MAVDAKTGKQIWKTKWNTRRRRCSVNCCGVINRGAALYDGKVFRGTLDDDVVALDMKTGKEIWKQNAASVKDGYNMTGAPLVAEGVLITGISGAEYAPAISSTAGIRRPASISGAPGPSRHRASRAATPGRATPGSSAAAPPGSPAVTTRAEHGLLGLGNPAPWTAMGRRRQSLHQLGDRLQPEGPARSSGLSVLAERTHGL